MVVVVVEIAVINLPLLEPTFATDTAVEVAAAAAVMASLCESGYMRANL